MFQFPKGMFITNFYTFPNRAEKKPDSMIVVSKNENGEKDISFIKSPEYHFYVTKDIIDQNGKLLNYISFDECKKVVCKYDLKYKEMAKATTNAKVKNFLKYTLENRDYKNLNELHLFPEFHSSDINIEDYYIKEFIKQHNYEDNNFGLDICCFDIEVDSSDWIGFPDENIAPCPVNMITLYSTKDNTLYLLALKYDTDTFNDFIQNKIKEAASYIKNLYKPHFGDFKIKPIFFKKELNLIIKFFNLINTIKPDYVTAWNARFDILTLYNRLKMLLAGTEVFPEDIMCPQEFPEKRVNIKLDTSIDAEQNLAKRFDNFAIYGYSNWIDMMCLYANITAPNGKKESYSLDDIGEEETGMNKENLADKGYNIKTVFLENYFEFFKYSGVDSLLLALIVKNTGFIDLLHMIVTMTRTRPCKALKKTVCLRNFAEYFYNLNGYAMSNNHAYLFPQEGGIKGAFVAPPELINPNGFINGIPSNKIFDLVIDMDLSRLYPSITEAFNISPDTMKYKIIYMEKKEINGTKILVNATDSFMEHYISNDVISYCHDYHNLPDIEEMKMLVGERL